MTLVYNNDNIDLQSHFIMISTLVSIPIAFILGIIVGFFVGRKRGTIFAPNMPTPFSEDVFDKQIKVLHKSEPKTHQQKVAEALDKDKKVIKTFYK